MFEEKARGGAAAVTMGHTEVNAEEDDADTFGLYFNLRNRQGTAALSEFAASIKQHGAHVSLQMNFGGVAGRGPDGLYWGPSGYLRDDGAVLLVVVILVTAVNLRSASNRASQRVEAAEEELRAVQILRSRYDEVDTRMASVEQRIRSGPRGEIFTTLESLARASAVTVDSMEPRTSPASDDYQETKVQVILRGVTLAQMVSYLDRIESAAQLLSIKSLRIRTRSDKPELLDVTFTVSSFEAI